METNNTFLDAYKKRVNEQKDDIGSTPDDINEKQDSSTDEKTGNTGFVKPKRSAYQPPSTPVKTRKTAAITIGIVAVVLVCIVGLFILLNRGIDMINIVGWTENDAQLWARSNGIMLQIEEEYNDEFEEGRVVSQSIAEGTRVKKGDFVRIVISLGHDLSVTLPIPDFMSMTRKEIDDWAAENFMTKVRITTEYSDTVEVGKVIRFEINDDRVVNEVRRDSPIYIIISKGPEDSSSATVEIPNFKIMALGECYIFADENGLLLTVEEVYDDFIPKGSIISQSVKPEEKVAAGAEIILVVSKGKMITVPDFSKYPKEMAAQVAGELGISITINEKYSGMPAGEFISQSIKAGTEYESGQMIELNYSIDNRISVPSFVGQTKDAIEVWAKDLNSRGASIKINTATTRSNSPAGTILTQDKSNTMISISATISITVSSGKIIYVPDFVAPSGSGYDVAITREKAIAMCEALNIVPIFVAESKSGRLPGEVWSQSISPGKEINEGTTITLKYNPANVQVTVPDFTNMTKAEILAKNYHKSFDIRFEVGAEYKDGMDDKVYEQSLTAGTKVASGTAITLTIRPKQIAEPGFD